MGSPPLAGSKTPMPKYRSIMMRSSVMPTTGVARICTHPVA